MVSLILKLAMSMLCSEQITTNHWVTSHMLCPLILQSTVMPTNHLVARFTDIDSSCTFCKQNIETISHFFLWNLQRFWTDLESYFFEPTNFIYSFNLKDIICFYDNSGNGALEYLINFVILYAKFYIHKQKFSNSSPNFVSFLRI